MQHFRLLTYRNPGGDRQSQISSQTSNPTERARARSWCVIQQEEVSLSSSYKYAWAHVCLERCSCQSPLETEAKQKQKHVPQKESHLSLNKHEDVKDDRICIFGWTISWTFLKRVYTEYTCISVYMAPTCHRHLHLLPNTHRTCTMCICAPDICNALTVNNVTYKPPLE